MKDLDSLRTPQLNELLESIGFNKSDIRKYAFIQAIQLIFFENTCYSKFYKELSWAGLYSFEIASSNESNELKNIMIVEAKASPSESRRVQAS